MVGAVARVGRWTAAGVLGVALVVALTFTPLSDALGLPAGVLVVLGLPIAAAMFRSARPWLLPGAVGAVVGAVLFVVAWNLSWS